MRRRRRPSRRTPPGEPVAGQVAHHRSEAEPAEGGRAHLCSAGDPQGQLARMGPGSTPGRRPLPATAARPGWPDREPEGHEIGHDQPQPGGA